MEREVDIRRRVAGVFNKREDEFEDLRSWNDYLNEVEDVTFNLVNGVEVEETKRRLEGYQRANEREIKSNAELAEEERGAFQRAQKEEKAAAKELRQAARREGEEEKREVAENRRDVLARLASGQDAEAVTRQGAQVTLKKRMDRKAAEERQRQLHAAGGTTNGSSDLVIKGLKAKKKAVPEGPIDPFGGLSFEGRRYYSIQDDYVWAGVQETKSDVLVGAGGYDVRDFTSRALCEAFAGLGVFIGEEVGSKDSVGPGNQAVATKGAAEIAAAS